MRVILRERRVAQISVGRRCVVQTRLACAKILDTRSRYILTPTVRIGAFSSAELAMSLSVEGTCVSGL
jgi:hypothetical protein